MSQFQVPSAPAEGQAPALPTRLKYEYTIGTESEVTYSTDRDLNSDREDDSFILKPQLQGFITYRPTDWLEGSAEVQMEREIFIEQTPPVRDGFDVLIDQANVTLKGFTDPFEFTVGRRNFEDDRHLLYDTSLDVAMITLTGKFRVEASVGREKYIDWNLTRDDPIDDINNYMLYAEYRGVEDHSIAGYAIYRDDRENLEGQPLFLGARLRGNPSDQLKYWAELAHVRGEDEDRRDLSGFAVDVGGTLRFLDLPLYPSITLGYAFASGDPNPEDGTNNAFRQTGLHSNETRMSGISEFKYYGEALDPDLSNIHIFTAGLGLRPLSNVTVDLVYHHYMLDEYADELGSSAITAPLNRTSKNVGDALDVVVGVRDLFGLRGLRVDLRGGWFFPGKGFSRNIGDEEDEIFADPDPSFSLTAKVFF